MVDDRHVVMMVVCPTCKTKQKVHAAILTGFAGAGCQTIQCIRCLNRFSVAVSDKIIRGPFST